MNEFVETVVVGAGPIGIETAIELQQRGLPARVYDAGPVGHTISWWAPQTRWFSSNDRIAIAGVPLHTVDQSKASREEYLNYLRGVVDQFDVDVRTFHRIVSIEPIAQEWDGNGEARQENDTDPPASLARWRLGMARVNDQRSSENGWEPDPAFFVDARSVVLAIGGTDFPNRLGVPGEDAPHVDGYLREVHRYHGRNVLIVGGRNSAVEAAIRLHRGGAKVTLCYHRDQLPDDGIKYWLRPEIEGLIRSGSIDAFFRSRVTAINGPEVTITTGQSPGETTSRKIAFDDVLLLIGYRQNPRLFGQLGIVSDAPSGAPVFDPETMQTTRAGVYVAGTAIGGTQSSRYQIFLENCHDHPKKIADHVCSETGVASGPEGDTQPVAAGSERGAVMRERAGRGDQGLRQRIELQPES
ncbi:NAD(P)-binding domain-containing protein [Rhodopirellula sallentina]|uniref:Thioredoxin reductase n=1 Tax=Rhodopirellula sallentina SM41 TaxID=1263870 RepID=M5TT53_9BACT|nr:NAD(P)-binding domain-containing protein [Rhodopirellula sallentina]EMI52340.1 thioredoxin reductase [Rhodopirellula sallentina SM41]